MKRRDVQPYLLPEIKYDVVLKSGSHVSQFTGAFFEYATAALTGGSLLPVVDGMADVEAGAVQIESKCSYNSGRWKIDYGQFKKYADTVLYFLWVYGSGERLWLTKKKGEHGG